MIEPLQVSHHIFARCLVLRRTERPAANSIDFNFRTGTSETIWAILCSPSWKLDSVVNIRISSQNDWNRILQCDKQDVLWQFSSSLADNCGTPLPFDKGIMQMIQFRDGITVSINCVLLQHLWRHCVRHYGEKRLHFLSPPIGTNGYTSFILRS